MAMRLEARSRSTTSPTTSKVGSGIEADGQFWVDGHGQIQEMASQDRGADQPFQKSAGARPKPVDVVRLGGQRQAE